MSEALLGVLIGGFVTIAAGVATEILRARRESRLDQDKRADDRRIGSDVFQRQTVLELQDALTAWIDVRGLVMVQEILSVREDGRRRVEPDIDEQSDAAERRVALLSGRILDDPARELVRQAVSRGPMRSLSANNEREVREAYAQARADVDEALENLAQLFRSLW